MSNAPVFSIIEALGEHLRSIATPRVVLTAGCFDPLHAGHVRFLSEAAAHGDFLVVVLHDDESTRRLKGEDRPAVSDAARAEVMAALSVVDAILVSGADDAGAVLDTLRPEVYVEPRGEEAPAAGREAAHALGIEVVRAGDPDGPRSDDVVRRIREGGV